MANSVWPELLNFIWYISPYLLFVCIVFFVVGKLISRKLKDRILSNTMPLLNGVVILLSGGIALTLLAASFFAPTSLSIYPLEMGMSSNLASSINGFMSPFIAVGAAILTFMAFWVQYTANQRIHQENKKQQCERQFYEMLKIHRDNVEKMEFVHLESEHESLLCGVRTWVARNQIKEKSFGLVHSTGHGAIQQYLMEFKCIYETLKPFYPKKAEQRFAQSYAFFYDGFHCDYLKDHECKAQNKVCVKNKECNAVCSMKIKINKTLGGASGVLQSSAIDGRKAVLNPYYRHLYLTVRSIVESDFSKSEKQNYLNVLRASLTSEEQTLLLFNWRYGNILKGGYGEKWECSEQKYFSEWKMIHNIVKKDFDFIEDMSSFEDVKQLLKTSKNVKKLFEEA